MADSEHEPRSEPAPQSPPQVFERPPVRYDDYKEWSVARASCASLHPRWEQLKDEANIALKEGDTERAIAGYTKALKVADPDVFVTGLFAALADASPRCMPCADRLVGAQQDIAPFIRQHVGGPAANEPNWPAALCLSNRAACHLRQDRPEVALADAERATRLCPEYVKGHYRRFQALTALGRVEEAADVKAAIERFSQLSQVGAASEVAHGIWLGLRLVHVGWLELDTYLSTYEPLRARRWREQYGAAAWRERGYSPSELPRLSLQVVGVPELLIASLFFIPSPGCRNQPGKTTPDGHAPKKVDYAYERRAGPEHEAAQVSSFVARLLRELPGVTTLALGAPFHGLSEETRRLLGSEGLVPTRQPEPAGGWEAGWEMGLVGLEARGTLDARQFAFAAGMCMTHRRYGYRGVIVGEADHTCLASEAWIAQMGVDDLPCWSRYQPFYHVLVDVRDRPGPSQCYVCHENTLPAWGAACEAAERRPVEPVQHPDCERLFAAFDSAIGQYTVHPDGAFLDNVETDDDEY